MVPRQLRRGALRQDESIDPYGEELPGANTQGATIEEARENLRRQQVSGTFGRPARKSVEGQQGRMEICLQYNPILHVDHMQVI